MSALTGPAVVREVVEQKLRDIDGDVVTDGQGDFVVQRGEISARVKVLGLEQDVTAVLVFAVVAVDIERLEEACRFLAAASLELPLAHFELHEGMRTIIASHTLLGELLSGGELRAAISGVTGAAAAYGPVLRTRFGAVAAGTPRDAVALLEMLRRVAAADQHPADRRPRSAVRRLTLVLAAVLATGAAAAAVLPWSWWVSGYAVVATLLVAFAVGTRLEGGPVAGSSALPAGTLLALVVMAVVAVAGAGVEWASLVGAGLVACVLGPLVGVTFVVPLLGRLRRDAGGLP
jgi:hypothetical protein